ncbi:MAG TPA: GNAT family N-acetyltransferase [Intrasporangium sp.]|uniref:GNAT family N-acetyltransferase n=1 Tax=Intrasporangium sp. TaxID=1925024 RepID=UPI002D77C2DC|nr:GNAT family N-acetyltransferase [Intrasporangium sp.]HET7399960.1 GNAT family N-acetyltransferase [Intrasporangium sp.]
MAEVIIRRAGADDALIVAALHLQSARGLGLPPEPGYLDRVADVWLSERPDRPTWIAQSRGEHAGLLEARRIRPLPWPGRPDISWLHVGVLFVGADHRGRGVGRALVEAAIEWCRTTDVKWIRLAAPDAAAKEFYERLGFTAPGRLMEYDLRDPR